MVSQSEAAYVSERFGSEVVLPLSYAAFIYASKGSDAGTVSLPEGKRYCLRSGTNLLRVISICIINIACDIIFPFDLLRVISIHIINIVFIS